MRKLSLDMTWTECLRMWKWISRQWLDPNHLGLSVGMFKRIWLENNGYPTHVDESMNCFFCRYAGVTRNFVQDCTECPGALIDKTFRCSMEKYNYEQLPREFYQELRRLHKIYLRNRRLK